MKGEHHVGDIDWSAPDYINRSPDEIDVLGQGAGSRDYWFTGEDRVWVRRPFEKVG
jgi:hypothetical protein